MKQAKSLIILLSFFVTCLCSATHANKTEAKILLFGDFGTGAPDQTLVAEDMADFCKTATCDFAITTGDNIYPRGVENLRDGKADYDRGTPNYQIITDVFVKNYSRIKIPFYMSFGNHDVGNEGVVSIFKDLIKSGSFIKNRTISLLRNQIQYSNHKDNPGIIDSLGRPSRLWFFPDEYYHVAEKNSVNLYSINTNTYPHRALNNTNDDINQKEKNYLQETWLKDNLKSRPSGWKIVFGHMPLYSHGRHSWLDSLDIKNFRKAIITTLCENKVDFYVSGHDHHLEVDKHECDNGHMITVVLTGAAAKRDRIYKSTFPLFSREKNLLWGNGKFFLGDESIYTSEDKALGFAFLSIDDDSNAKLTMKLTAKSSASQNHGCFSITKGTSIIKARCDAPLSEP